MAQDALYNELELGDIVVRIYDWGSCDLSILSSETPAGYFRTIKITHKSEGMFQPGNLMKSTTNLIKIEDETTLERYLEKRHPGQLRKENELARIIIEEANKIKNQ